MRVFLILFIFSHPPAKSRDAMVMIAVKIKINFFILLVFLVLNS